MKTYYTHAGAFHADEVFGYALLKDIICDKYVRLTDVNNIPNDGIIAEIGRIYDPENDKFDHHQGFLTRDDGFPYATIGLLWKKYGKEVILHYHSGLTDQEVNFVLNKVDKDLIKGLDAADTDNKYTQVAACSAGNIKIYTISDIIDMFNGEDVNNHFHQKGNFDVAIGFAKGIIITRINVAVNYINNKKTIDEIIDFKGKHIAVLDVDFAWKNIMFDNYPDVYFVISKSSHPGSPYSLIATPKHKDTRELIIPIERPVWFEGFIHQGKWIAGGKNIEELVKLAKYNLEHHE